MRLILPSILIFSLFSLHLSADEQASAILNQIDQNMMGDTARTDITLNVHMQTTTRQMSMITWNKTERFSLVEYTSPPRDKGVKMLKRDDNLWIYYPKQDRTIKIAGHMLKQSVMGTDMSYEDLTQMDSLEKYYDATIIGSETLHRRDCHILELVQKANIDEKPIYYRRKIWVDKSRFIMLREDLFAKSGKILKRFDTLEVFQVDNRWYPKRVIFKDQLKDGGGTEYIVNDIQFDAPIPDSLFSTQSLRR